MKSPTDSIHAATEHNSQGTLLRVLGVGFGLAVTIGGTIGMGILRTPGEVAAQLPTPKLFLGVWLLGGVFALLGASSVAELGAMIPRSGGWYVFVHRAMGNYPGFVVGWSDWLSTCGTLAVIAMVVGEYAAVLVPRLAGRDKPVALAVVLSFAALQWRGIRWGSFTQNLTSLLKTVIFAAIAIAAFTFAGKSGAGTPLPVPHSFALFTALIIALQGVLYTYDGWYGVIYFGEEVRNPKRDVVRSMFGGVLLVIAIYLVVNLAYVYVLPMSQLAGENFAAGAVANKIFGAYGDKTIRVLAILSLLSTINAYTLTAPRILYAMSCDELFARRASQGQPRRHADRDPFVEHHRRSAFHRQRNLQRGAGRAGVFLCRELCDGLHLCDCAAPARTGSAASLSRLGLSLDDSDCAARFGRVPGRRGNQ